MATTNVETSNGLFAQPRINGRSSPSEDITEGFLRDALYSAKNAERKVIGIAGSGQHDSFEHNGKIDKTVIVTTGAHIPGSLDMCGTLKLDELSGTHLTTIKLDESSANIGIGGISGHSHTMPSTLGVPTLPSQSLPIPPDMSGGFSATFMSSAPVEVPWCADAEAELHGLLVPFLTMERRRMRRYQHGRVRQRGLVGHFTYALQMLLFMLLFSHAVSVDWSIIIEYRWIPSVMTAAIILVVVTNMCLRPEHLFTEFVRMEIFIFVLWIVWEYDRQWHEKEKCWWWRWCAAENELVLFKVFGVLFGITLFLFFIRLCCVPFMLQRCLLQKGSVHTWWKVKPVMRRNSSCFPGLAESQALYDEEEAIPIASSSPLSAMSAAAFSYRPFGWLSFFRASFGYVGEKDSQGRPHGKGIWFDNSFHGECLRGNWIHGEPRGTFTSREYGTGAQFAQRPIAYATSRGDCTYENLAKTTVFPCKAEKLRYGLAQVEVSYAGGFYKFLPLVERRYHSECASVGDVMKQFRRVLQPKRETEDNIKKDDRKEPKLFLQDPGLAVLQQETGYSPKNNDSSPRLQLPAFGHTKLMTGPPMEALVFFHGFNADLQTALGRMGQLSALGNMAPHVVPFVFSYSGGSTISYFDVKRRMQEYAEDLKTFFLNLSKHFRTFHIIGHSAGADFFFLNFPALVDCFAPVPDSHNINRLDTVLSDSDSSTLPHLRSVTIINGDVLVSTVCERLPEVMRFAHRFTSYSDDRDDPLFWSEFVQTYFPHICCLRRLLKGTQAPREGHKPLVFGKCIAPLWMETSSENGKAIAAGPMVKMLQQGKRRTASLHHWRSMMGMNSDLRSLVPNVDSSKYDDRIDIIDCSTIDQNVHKMRHFYYMLNTQVVEDICDLLVNRTPARDRSRLVRVDCNVFNFLCPPANLVEI